MKCKELQEKLLLYPYDELPTEERAACEAHLAECERCRSQLEEVHRLHDLLHRRPAARPSLDLLVQCRQSLDDALDREELGWRSLLRGWHVVLPGVPASGAVAVLLLLGLGFGLGWSLRPRVMTTPSTSVAPGSASLAGSDLDDMRIRGISRVAPDPQTGAVRITLDAERRMTLEGSLEDPRIQRVLLYAMKSDENPGIRRDTLEALQTHAENPSVRQVLLDAMRHDPNPGVRLEALYAGQELEWNPEVRRAFLEALERDNNPGVRVAAVDVLAKHADEEIVPVLRRLTATDSNRYVRLKSASALREIGSDE